MTRDAHDDDAAPANGPVYLQLRDLQKAINSDIATKAKARGGTIPWIKDYAGQLEDPEYTMLTFSERGILKDLRLLAARRGNKILLDEQYLRVQLRCSPRTQCVHKVSRLRALGFLEPYTPATETPANGHHPSHPNLTPSENNVSLEVEVEVPPPTPPTKGGHPTRTQKAENTRLNNLTNAIHRFHNPPYDLTPEQIIDELERDHHYNHTSATQLVRQVLHLDNNNETLGDAA